MNPDSSSEKTRHSGAGRNPVDKQIPTQVGQHLGFVCFAVYFYRWIPACAGMTA
jgi:hypothetical protein